MKPEKLRIAIVDDHRMFREGLKFMLGMMQEVEVVNESSNGLEFISGLDQSNPDLVLMDIAMPEMDGIEATRKALAKQPDLKIIALSMFGDTEYYKKMIQAGAKGFLVKESGPDELEKAIMEVLGGGNYFSQHLMQNIILNIAGKNEEEEEVCPVEFTKRELEVLTLICSGLTNAEIASELNLSLRTVEGHRSRLISRTGVKNSIQLVLYVLRYNMVKLNPAKGKANPVIIQSPPA